MKHLALLIATFILLNQAAHSHEYSKEIVEFNKTVKELGNRPDLQKSKQRIKKLHLDAANKAISSHEYRKADKLFDEAIEAWKETENNLFSQYQIYWILRMKLMMYARSENIDKLEASIGRVSEMCPNIPYPKYQNGYRYGIAEICVKRKQYEKAEKFFKEFLQDRSIMDLYREKTTYERMRASAISQLSSAIENQGRVEDADSVYQNGIKESLDLKNTAQTRILRVSYKEFLKRHNRLGKIATIDEKLNDRHCPICKSDKNILRMTYGYQIGASQPGTRPGGCMVSPGSPKFYCETDKIEF